MADDQEDFLIPRFEGDEIAPFANETNKALDRDVRKKRKEVEEINSKNADVTERLQVITDHLKNVKHEVENTQALITAKRKEIESESHMTALTDRQSGRLESEQRKLDRIIQEYLDRANSLQSEIFKGNERLDQLKLEMNWNQEELEQWALAARQKEEDQLTLEKYKRADEIKVRDLVLATEKLTLELSEKKRVLDREVTETQAAQLELDRTASHFKNLHQERRKLLQQWQETFELFRNKELSIEASGAKVKEKQSELARKKFNQIEAQKILDQVSAQGVEHRSAIQATDRTLAEQRIATLAMEKDVSEFRDDVTLLRNELSAISSKLGARKEQQSAIAQDLEGKKAHLIKLQKNEQAAAKKLDQHKNLSLTKEQLAQEAEQLLAEQQDRLTESQRDVKQTKDLLFSHNQNLYKLREQEATIMGEISGSEASKKTIMFQLHRLDQERQRQQELTYRVEYQCQMMLREVARVSGERSADEQKELTKKIKDTKKLIGSNQKFMKTIEDQIKKLDSDIRHSQRDTTEATKKQSQCNEELEKLSLECNSLQRAANQAAKIRDTELVQLDKLQLEAKRLRELVSERGAAVFQKTNELEGIKLTLRERNMEVKVHTETCRAAVRTADEERHQLVLELAERKQKVNQLAAKHSSLEVKNLGETGADEMKGGEKESQARHLIKAAADKEALQRKGDTLEASNQELVKVIKSLQNVLSHLVATNAAYKQHLQVGVSGTDDAAVKEQKERIYIQVNEQLFLKNKELDALTRDAEVEGSRVRELVRKRDDAQGKITRYTAERNQLERQITLQDVEVDEAHKEMIVQRSAAVNAGAMDGPRAALVEMEIQAAVVREQNAELLKSLHASFADNPDVLASLSRILEKNSLRIPSL